MRISTGMSCWLWMHGTLGAVAQELGPRAINSLRVLAAILLVTMLCALIYVLRRMREMKDEPHARGPTPPARANHILIFVACAVIFVAACVLLFLVAKSGSAI